jgi:transcriptional regulator NrdR family protein
LSLEFLWPQHGHEQVSEQQQGDHAHNQVFHRLLLKLLAEADIQAANHEEQHRDTDIDEISHIRFALSYIRFDSCNDRSSHGGRRVGNQKPGTRR